MEGGFGPPLSALGFGGNEMHPAAAAAPVTQEVLQSLLEELERQLSGRLDRWGARLERALLLRPQQAPSVPTAATAGGAVGQAADVAEAPAVVAESLSADAGAAASAAAGTAAQGKAAAQLEVERAPMGEAAASGLVEQPPGSEAATEEATSPSSAAMTIKFALPGSRMQLAQETQPSAGGTGTFGRAPRTFVLQAGLLDDATTSESAAQRLLDRCTTRTHDLRLDASARALLVEEEEEDPSLATSRCVLRPSSSRRLLWDMIATMLIAFDLLSIPIQLAFQPEQTSFLKIQFWFALIYWSCDMPMSFRTGYYHRGAEEMRPRKIAKRYLKTWFTFDVFVVSSDLFSWFGEGDRSPALARLGKSLRMIRLVRSLRLIRLVKLQKVLQNVMDHIDSEHLLIFCGIVKHVILILCCNHIIACAWYGIGSLASEGVDTWVAHTTFGETHDFAYAYLTSLHWSLTQFTPASMEVVPRNTHERLFSVIVLIFALVVFSSFVSSLSSSMTQLRQMTFKYDKGLAILRKYLRNRMIRAGLSIRILRFVEYKLNSQKTEIRDADVDLLQLLSAPLQMELVMETLSPWLIKHPFFHHYALLSPACMQDVCNTAVSRVSFSQGDVIFADHEASDKMLLVLKGLFKYFHKREHLSASTSGLGLGMQSDKNIQDSVSVGAWCSEASLWTDWAHVGWLQAAENSEVFFVTKDKFTKATTRREHMLSCSRQYGSRFVEHLNQQSRTGKLSDLNCLEDKELQRIVRTAFAMDFDDGGLPAFKRQVSPDKVLEGRGGLLDVLPCGAARQCSRSGAASGTEGPGNDDDEDDDEETVHSQVSVSLAPSATVSDGDCTPQPPPNTEAPAAAEASAATGEVCNIPPSTALCRL